MTNKPSPVPTFRAILAVAWCATVAASSFYPISELVAGAPAQPEDAVRLHLQRVYLALIGCGALLLIFDALGRRHSGVPRTESGGAG